MKDSQSSPGSESGRTTCKFCGTVAALGDEPNCSSLEEAWQQTGPRPYGCPWFDKDSRKRHPRVAPHPDAAAQRQQVPTGRQYYYRSNGCKADHAYDPTCICWHDEGTGPLAADASKASDWRMKPNSPPSQGAGNGEAVVPTEPTREMWAAGANAVVAKRGYHHDIVVEAVYRAMIAAAPQPTTAGYGSLPFLCPCCGARGTTDGKASTVPSTQSHSPADEIIGQIETRFPDWHGFRDLVDCIDVTLHRLRGGS